jgi:mannosylglycerate hydrolase
MQHFIKSIDTSNYKKDDILIVVFNPLPYPRQEIVQAWIDMPDDTPKNPGWFAYCPPEGIKIVDSQGNSVSTQWQGSSKETCCVSGLHTRSLPYNSIRHKVYFDTGTIPACGYKVFKAARLDEQTSGKAQLSTSNSTTGNILKSPDTMENEFLKVKMNPNGTFDITDKRSGKCFANMNYYEDSGQVGDYWVNKKPANDRVYNSLGCNAQIWAQDTGPLKAALVNSITMHLPVGSENNPTGRSSQLKDMTIKTSVSLSAGSDIIEVEVEFENNHQDHRLRVMFPTGLEKAKSANAGGHFIVDTRDIKPQGPQEGAIWPDMATQPHSDFVDISDGKNSIAFINDCLTEYEVLEDDKRTVALTLLRAVKNWICTEFRVGSEFPSQKGSQCFGRHSYRYAIKPYSGSWQQGDIAYAAQNFNAPLRLVQTAQHSNKKASLPSSECSFIGIDNKMLRFSALKKANDRNSLIIRIYNPSSDTQKGILNLYKPAKQAWLTDLNEKRLE